MIPFINKKQMLNGIIKKFKQNKDLSNQVKKYMFEIK